MKYAWVDRHRDVFALSEMCAVLNVSIAGYRASQKGGKPHRKRLTDSQMLFHIQVVHAEVKKAYGSPRMVKELRARGLPACSAQSLNRQFKPELPNQAWVSDITYLWTDEGWLYLAIVMDLFNREIVGFSIKPGMTADLISDALTMAWFRRRPGAGLMVHSDRGSQYCSNTYQTKLKSYGMVCSMSRKGNCWDNAPAESWFGSFKNEAIYGNRFATHELMKTTCFDYIEVRYNRKRLHSSLGYQSPKQYLQNWLAKRKEMLVA